MDLSSFESSLSKNERELKDISAEVLIINNRQNNFDNIFSKYKSSNGQDFVNL